MKGTFQSFVDFPRKNEKKGREYELEIGQKTK